MGVRKPAKFDVREREIRREKKASVLRVIGGSKRMCMQGHLIRCTVAMLAIHWLQPVLRSPRLLEQHLINATVASFSPAAGASTSFALIVKSFTFL